MENSGLPPVLQNSPRPRLCGQGGGTKAFGKENIRQKWEVLSANISSRDLTMSEDLDNFSGFCGIAVVRS